jgi:phage shock protein PspC (stress-responsive transcriptional regulator)
MQQPTVNERSRDLREWHRDYAERRIAGVCAGLAAQLDWSVTAVRAGFILLTLFPFFHGVGVWLYLVLWFLMPAEPGAASGLDRVLDVVNSLLRSEGDERRDRTDY